MKYLNEDHALSQNFYPSHQTYSHLNFADKNSARRFWTKKRASILLLTLFSFYPYSFWQSYIKSSHTESNRARTSCYIRLLRDAAQTMCHRRIAFITFIDVR